MARRANKNRSTTRLWINSGFQNSRIKNKWPQRQRQSYPSNRFPSLLGIKVPNLSGLWQGCTTWLACIFELFFQGFPSSKPAPPLFQFVCYLWRRGCITCRVCDLHISRDWIWRALTESESYTYTYGMILLIDALPKMLLVLQCQLMTKKHHANARNMCVLLILLHALCSTSPMPYWRNALTPLVSNPWQRMHKST